LTAARVASGLRGRSAPLALVLLVAANLVPLVGVLFLGWDVRTILVMYWLENGIVGVLNVVRMLAAQGPDQQGQASLPAKAGLAAFFAVHYGIFWMVHGVFVMTITAPLGFLSTGFESPLDAVTQDSGILLGATALLASHLASLLLNYFGKGEYKRVSPVIQMFSPYVRVFVLHLTVIIGGFVIIGLGQPVLLVALLVAFKTIADVGFHLYERGRYARATAVA
jgi:uncharacterized protein DUF6498